MTAEEFEVMYAEAGDTTVEELRALGIHPVRCDCGEDCCAGWWMSFPPKARS